MKILGLFLMIALGTAALLYCRVDLGMNWSDMSSAIDGTIPKLLIVGVALLGVVLPLGYGVYKEIYG